MRPNAGMPTSSSNMALQSLMNAQPGIIPGMQTS